MPHRSEQGLRRVDFSRPFELRRLGIDYRLFLEPAIPSDSSCMESAWKIWLGIAGFLTALFFVSPQSPDSRLALYSGTALLAVIVVFIAATRMPANRRGPWLWIGAALASFVLGDVAYYVLERRHGEFGTPFPSIADLFYLGMYPLLTFGLVRLGRMHSQTRSQARMVEAVVVGFSLFALMWILFVDDLVSLGQGSRLATIVALAYPMLETLVMTATVFVIANAVMKHPAMLLAAAGVGSLAIADIAYNVHLNNGTFRTGLYVDFFWLAFFALIAAGALYHEPTTETARPGNGIGSASERSGLPLAV